MTGLETIEQGLALARAEHAATRGELETAVGLLSQARQRIAELEAQLPPPLPPTIFGLSKPGNTPGLGLPIPATRLFFQPGERPTELLGDNLRAFQSVESGGLVWISIKERAGAWFDELLSDMERLFPDILIFATANHEPREFWESGRWAEWESRQESFEDVLEGHSAVQGWTIVEGSWIGKDDRYAEGLLRQRQGYGMDSYHPRIGEPIEPLRPPAEIHVPRIEWAKARGKDQVAVGETGVGRLAAVTTGPQTPEQVQTEWARENRETLTRPDVPAALWWNSGGGGPFGTGCRLSLAGGNAWLGR